LTPPLYPTRAATEQQVMRDDRRSETAALFDDFGFLGHCLLTAGRLVHGCAERDGAEVNKG
jgi:hypothetical protein